MVVSDNKFVFGDWEIYSPMSWENLMCYMFSSSFTQHKVMKEYIFMTGLQKDNSNPVFSCARTDGKIWLQSLWQRYRKFPVKLEISVNFGT